MASPYLNKKTYVLKQIVILKLSIEKPQAQIALLSEFYRYLKKK